jgi:amino acid transporter
MVSLIVLTSGYDVFTKGNFTASGFLTSYLNIGIFAGTYPSLIAKSARVYTDSNTALYIFFKFFLKSKVIPLDEIDIRGEFEEIEKEKAQGLYLTKDQLDWPWWRRALHWI